MKKLVSIICVIIIFIGCQKTDDQINYDKIELSEFVLENYYKDAQQLYFHEVIQNKSHPNYNESELNVDEIKNILKIIQAVYDSKSPERDIVFDEHQIHGYYCYSFSSISLKVKTETPEIENLSNQITPTGNKILDSLLEHYSLDSVRTLYSYPDFPWLTLYTKEEFNMIPVEKELSLLEPVLIAESNKICVGDGNNITLERNKSVATITFSIGSGDCPAGCIYHKYWEFKVSNGKAKFVRTYEN